MKIQRVLKGRGLRAILCGLICFLCVAVMDIPVYAEVNMTDYPSVYLSPDASEWTTYDDFRIVKIIMCHILGQIIGFLSGQKMGRYLKLVKFPVKQSRVWGNIFITLNAEVRCRYFTGK